MPPAVTWRSAATDPILPRLLGRSRSAPVPRIAAISAATLVLASVFGTVAAGPASASVTCANGSTPAQNSTLVCDVAGSAEITVPAGTTTVDVDVVGGGGGAGYPARQHIGGNAAEITGSLSLPAGTAYLYVVVGTGGTGDNHGTSIGGGASAVLAENGAHALLAKLVIAGAGGGGAYNGDGGNAGSAGTSDNAQVVSGPGSPGVGPTGGAGGTGNYANGAAGQTNDPTALGVAAGGAGAGVPGGAYGGGGAGGYAGGGGGGGSTNGILNRNVAGGGGGSSLASAYLGSASIALDPSSGGVQLPGLVAGDGATGKVALTFNGESVPAAPRAVTATPGDGQASVSFTAPAADGGSPITSYTVTASPGGQSSTCPGSPCLVTGLTNGTSYTFTAVADNANGSSAASPASNAVTPALAPGAPTAVEATAADSSALVSWTAPASDGGSAITGYTVTASPGGKTATCVASPCDVTGLENGKDYTFTVVATNPVGGSAPSDASASVRVSAVPDAPSISGVTHGNGSATVTFDAPAQDGGSAITGYTLTASPGGASVACENSPCTIDGLDNGTSYTLRVVATNAAGSSEPSAASDAITPATVSDAPTALTVDRGDTTADLTFDAPDNDGGAKITGYEVSVDGGKTWSELSVEGSGPVKATVTGLSNGTRYEIAVRAVNDEGHSAATSLSNVTPAGTPGIPSDVTVSRGDQQMTVSWTSPDDNGAGIDGYRVDVPELGKTFACDASPCVIDGLTNGDTYTFRVRAHNEVGSSAWSALSDGVVPATTPKAPDVLGLYSGDGVLYVRFTPVGTADDGGDAVTRYEYTLDGDTWHSLPTESWGTTGDLGGHVDGLENGTAQTLHVRAVNGVGGGAGSAALTETPATVPSAPRSVEVSSSNGRTTVSWKVPTSDGGSPITGYHVVADPGGEPCDSDGTHPSCTFTDLTAGATYEFSVRAVNIVPTRFGTGQSAAASTGPVLVTDTPSAPAQLSVAPGDRTATLTFTVPVSDGGKPVSGYDVSTDDGATWHAVDTTAVPGSATERTTMLGALLNGSTYPIAVRARNADGAGARTPASRTYLPPWFTDPVSVGDRAAEVPVPAKPTSYKGKLVHTVATNRSHDGTVATDGASLQGRQLQPGQAVQLTAKLFRGSTSTLTRSGKKQLASVARSLTYVDAISCEGYTNYGSPKKKGLTSLAKKRATAVCTTLRKEAEQVGVEAKIGYGGDHPMVVGGTYAKRVDNRRIVVVIDR